MKHDKVKVKKNLYILTFDGQKHAITFGQYAPRPLSRWYALLHILCHDWKRTA